MSSDSFAKWINEIAYPIEWCNVDEPIVFGSKIIKNHQPSFWVNRPICVKTVGTTDYGIVIKYLDDERIVVKWNEGGEDTFYFREYDCLLKYPYIYNKDIIELMAKELWNVLCKTPKSSLQVNYNIFRKEFFYLMYSWS